MNNVLMILAAFFGIGCGLFMALLPGEAIDLYTRSRFDRAEPSEHYLRMTRLEGAGLLAVSLVFLLLLLFAPE